MQKYTYFHTNQLGGIVFVTTFSTHSCVIGFPLKVSVPL